MHFTFSRPLSGSGFEVVLEEDLIDDVAPSAWDWMWVMATCHW